MLLDVDNDKELDCEIERVSEGLPVRLSEPETEGVIEGDVVSEPETLSEMVGDRVTEGDTDTVIVIEGDRVGVTDAEKEIVTEVETDGLGVEEMGGDGDRIPTLPKKW